MSGLEVTAPALPRMAAALSADRVAGRIGTAADRAVRRLTATMTEEARSRAPIGSGPTSGWEQRRGLGHGTLRARIRGNVSGEGINVRGQVHAPPTVNLLKHGTSPHPIEPHASALRLPDGFVSGVSHPGSPANAFWPEVAHGAPGKARHELAEAGPAITAGIAGDIG